MPRAVRRGPGRPRSESATQAIQRAVFQLLRTHSYGDVTLELIAREAGVGRQTIYRWWSSKADVILDALNARAGMDVPATDLVSFVRATYTIAPRYVPILRAVMAEALLDRDFEQRFREHFLKRRRAVLKEIVARELPQANADLVADQVFGPLWYLILTRPSALTAEYGSYVLKTIGVAGAS
jgi:AcrR family transcriptional regulator